MTTVSIDEAAKTLPALMERAQTESVFIRDSQGVTSMLLSFGPRTDDEREEAWRRAEILSVQGSRILEESLAKDGIAVGDFLANVFEDE